MENKTLYKFIRIILSQNYPCCRYCSNYSRCHKSIREIPNICCETYEYFIVDSSETEYLKFVQHSEILEVGLEI